jgi:putative sigma-54 modulation protein
MNINYTWRNAEKSDAIEELTSKKLERIERHFEKITQVHITYDLMDKQTHLAKATLHIPGHELVATGKEKDMYKAVDEMITKLLRQVDEHKEKMKKHRD